MICNIEADTMRSGTISSILAYFLVSLFRWIRVEKNETRIGKSEMIARIG